MVTWSLTERLRARLQGLIKHGDAANIERASARRRKGAGVSAKNLSYFLHGHRKHPLSIEDIEDVAFYYNLSLGGLLEPTRKQSELAGPEQRLLIAYRAAPPDVQAAALVMLEAAHAPAAGAPRRRFAGGLAVAHPHPHPHAHHLEEEDDRRLVASS